MRLREVPLSGPSMLIAIVVAGFALIGTLFGSFYLLAGDRLFRSEVTFWSDRAREPVRRVVDRIFGSLMTDEEYELLSIALRERLERGHFFRRPVLVLGSTRLSEPSRTWANAHWSGWSPRYAGGPEQLDDFLAANRTWHPLLADRLDLAVELVPMAFTTSETGGDRLADRHGPNRTVHRLSRPGFSADRRHAVVCTATDDEDWSYLFFRREPDGSWKLLAVFGSGRHYINRLEMKPRPSGD